MELFWPHWAETCSVAAQRVVFGFSLSYVGGLTANDFITSFRDVLCVYNAQYYNVKMLAQDFTAVC